MDHDQALPQRWVERLLDNAASAFALPDLPQAIGLALQADAQAQAAGLPALAARAQVMLFELHIQQSDHPAAVRHAVNALGQARQAGNSLLTALAQVALAQVAAHSGDRDLALAALDEAWPVAKAQGAAALQFRCEQMMAEVYQALGQASLGLPWCNRAQATARAAGLAEQEAMATAQEAELWLALGDEAMAKGDAAAAQAPWHRAQQANRQAMQMARQADATDLLMAALCRHAVLLARRREDAAALQAFELARQAIEALPDAHWLTNLDRQVALALECARLMQAMGQTAEARAAAERGVALGELSHARESLPPLYLLASELAEACDDLPAALTRHRQFHQSHSQLHQERAQRSVRVQTARLRAEREVAEAETAREQARWHAQAQRELNEPAALTQALLPLDELTGLANRQHLELSLVESHDKARARGAPLSLALLELGDFAALRQQHGTSVAAAVLRTLAGLLVAQCRPEDLVARLSPADAVNPIDATAESAARAPADGGFALVLAGIEADRAQNVCDRIHAAVQRYPWTRLAPGLSVAVTLGVCEVAAGADPIATLAQAERDLQGTRASGWGVSVGCAA